MVAAQRGVDVDKARGPVKLALKKMVANNLVKQLKVSFFNIWSADWLLFHVQ